jgi:hypothetical protein
MQHDQRHVCYIGIVDYFCRELKNPFPVLEREIKNRLRQGYGGQCGVWRSWLAHLHGVQGVVCSSQITPTKTGWGFAIMQTLSFIKLSANFPIFM